MVYTTGMICRIWYALCMMRRHHKALKAYIQDPALQVKSVLEIDLLGLKEKRGIRAIVLDFDGVLAPHGENSPNPKLESWLNLCLQIFGSGYVFILTNVPTVARQNYFKQHFTGIKFALGKKKPYPNTIQQIAHITHLNTKELLIVDDRLLTGILAAILAGASGCYITMPLVNFLNHPIKELFMMSLRKIDRWLILASCWG